LSLRPDFRATDPTLQRRQHFLRVPIGLHLGPNLFDSSVRADEEGNTVHAENWPSATDSCRFPRCERSSDGNVPRDLESRWIETERNAMIQLPYSLVVEATEDPDFFGFYSPDLEGFTGIGHSIEDCLYQALWGMKDHAQTLREHGLPIPPPNPNPSIVVQNERKLEPA